MAIVARLPMNMPLPFSPRDFVIVMVHLLRTTRVILGFASGKALTNRRNYRPLWIWVIVVRAEASRREKWTTISFSMVAGKQRWRDCVFPERTLGGLSFGMTDRFLQFRRASSGCDEQ